MKVKKSEGALTAKQNAAEKRRANAKRIDSLFKGGDEPSINPLDYKITMIKALNWYNLNADLKTLRTYLNQYLINTDRKKLIPILNKVDDFYIRSLGTICRLKNRDQYLIESDLNFIESKIDELKKSVEIQPIIQPKPVSTPKVEVKIDKNYELVLKYSEAFEEAIDKFVIDKKVEFNPEDYLKANEVPSAVSKKMGEFYKSMLNELQEALDGNDKDLVEGYKNFTKTQLKRFVAFIDSLIVACNQRVVSAKVKKPRVKKVIPPEKLVSKLKYLKEWIPLKLKSVKPTTMIDSNEIWLYNTKTKRLVVYKSSSDAKLSIRGTAVTGYDVANSVSVLLRKPDEFFKGTQLAKRALSNALKEIKTKPSPATGRINEDMIILGAF